MQTDNTSQPRHCQENERTSQTLEENVSLDKVKLKKKKFNGARIDLNRYFPKEDL